MTASDSLPSRYSQSGSERMNLTDLYRAEGNAALVRLARAVGANPKYLYQCATGRRRPSPELAFRLVDVEPRLNFEAMYRDARGEAEKVGEAA